MGGYWGGYSYLSNDALRRKAEASIKKARAEGQIMEPVALAGRTIASSWWGKAWCDNLERYADYDSRLDRGRRYVRAGAVIDLKIQPGKVLAQVQGSSKKPYRVEVDITPVSEKKCEEIIRRCTKKVENLEQLLAGNFPEELKELFQGKDGLFPTPKEISFTCSCPDWAFMCKHVAAALYGTGVRLDFQPALFFKLRGIQIEQFIDKLIENRVETMLANAQKPSRRILEGQDIESLFGVL